MDGSLEEIGNSNSYCSCESTGEINEEYNAIFTDSIIITASQFTNHRQKYIYILRRIYDVTAARIRLPRFH